MHYKVLSHWFPYYKCNKEQSLVIDCVTPGLGTPNKVNLKLLQNNRPG